MNDTTVRLGNSERLATRRSGFSRWAPLVFFAFILIGPIFSPDAGAEDWLLAVGVVAVALPTFVVSEIRGWDIGGAAVLMLLALATAPFDSTAIMALPIYAAALVARSATQETLRLRLSVITALTLTGFFLSSIPWPFRVFIFIPVVMIWVIGSAVFHDVSRDHRAVVLRAENRRIAHLATIAERERIARDVHDIAGQALTAIIVRSQLVQRLATSDQRRATDEADEVERIARDALSSIRKSVAGWHQASLLDELAVARDALAAAGTDLEALGDWEVDLAPSVENVLALGLREAVTNVLRHANAGTVEVRIDSQDGGVSLTVTDDGIGPAKGTGSGILGMRERVIAAGGTLTFGPGVTGGTELRIDMPFGGELFMIRVVLAEDQAMVRGAFAGLLDLEPDIEVVAVAEDGEQGLAAVAEHEPDILLTDIEMPGMTGLELASRLKDHPTVRVVIVTTFARTGYLRRALDAGVSGYVLKDSPIEDLADTLRRVAAGNRVIAPELAVSAWAGSDPLTDREREVLREVGEGHPNVEIAQRLHLAEGTVRNYLSSAIVKLGARNRTEAFAKAQEMGYL